MHNPVIPAIAKFEVSIKKGNYTNYGIIAIVPAIVEFEVSLAAASFTNSKLFSLLIYLLCKTGWVVNR